MLVRDEIISNIGELSVTPRVIRHLSRLLRSPDDDMTEAIQALRAEPVLTASMLAACNAPGQYRGARVTDLDSAICHLGYRETYRIALLVTFRQGFRMRHVSDPRIADFLWRRAATAACAMEAYSAYTTQESYTIGLLHLIGCFILARDNARAKEMLTADSEGLATAQADIMGIAYPEAGAIALQQWGFPESVTTPIRAQLFPDTAGQHQEVAAQLTQAAAVALHIEACRPGSPIFNEGTASAPADRGLQEIELAASGLMEAFQGGKLQRPKWALTKSEE